MKIKFCCLLVLGLFLFSAISTARAETFTAFINGAQEVQATGSGGTGFGRVFLDEGAGMITFTVTFTGLSSDQTMAHIHAPGVIGVNGPIAVTLGSPGGTSNTITGTAAVSPTLIAQMRAHQTYINIHTVNFPNGEIRGQLAPKRVIDYDGDGKTDYSVLRFPNIAPPGVSQITYWNRNSSGFAANQTIPWGDANLDFPAPGDYDGDGKDDLAVYRAGASTGQQSFFLILRSSDGTAQFLPWGISGDQAVARDYDGDGITDAAIFRRGAASTSPTEWFIRQSSNGMLRVETFGLTGNGTTTFDTPIPGDYDGDGKFDLAVYRFGQSPGNNYIVKQSSDNAVIFRQWGNFNTDYIAPGDFDGDGKFDFVAARTGATATSPMTWFILQSSDSQVRIQQFGISSDVPTQGDYDGDGVTDISVFRSSASGADSAFYTFASFTNSFLANNWGVNGDFAVNTFDAR
ncbi:MAG: CHRD domain-containing protein [Pyrinomonadaceae bacterium]